LLGLLCRAKLKPLETETKKERFLKKALLYTFDTCFSC